MQQLETLIRLSKFQLDEKRRRLSGLRELASDLQNTLIQLESQAEQEKQLSHLNPKIYDAYCKEMQKQRNTIMLSVHEIENEIEIISDDIAEAFQELKRYETTHESNIQRSKRAKNKKHQNVMDEFGSLATLRTWARFSSALLLNLYQHGISARC